MHNQNVVGAVYYSASLGAGFSIKAQSTTYILTTSPSALPKEGENKGEHAGTKKSRLSHSLLTWTQ